MKRFSPWLSIFLAATVLFGLAAPGVRAQEDDLRRDIHGRRRGGFCKGQDRYQPPQFPALTCQALQRVSVAQYGRGRQPELDDRRVPDALWRRHMARPQLAVSSTRIRGVQSQVTADVNDDGMDDTWTIPGSEIRTSISDSITVP